LLRNKSHPTTIKYLAQLNSCVADENLLCYRRRMACCVVGENQKVMEYVESQVRARRKLRDLAAEIGIGKSSISRHMCDCVGRREAVKHHRERKINLVSCRVITAWPIEGGFRFTLQTEYDSHGQGVEKYCSTNEVVEVPAAELRESDVFIVVTYDKAREPRNLKALSPDEPDAAPVETEPDADELPAVPESVVRDDTFLVTAPEPTPTPCEHVMVRVSGDISRCVNCGHQTEPFSVRGVSRKSFENQHQRRNTFGRFG
jgi:hypothetical protein